MGVGGDAPAPLRTVDRALQVLLEFDSAHPHWRSTELARHLGWDKSVTSRLLATLAHRGFLVADPENRGYRLGPAAYELGQLAARDNPLLTVARPLLRDLARQTRETALFTVPDGDEALCLAAIEGPAAVRYSTQVGGRIPGNAGAGAKVLFAWRSEREQRALFGQRTLAHFTDETPTESAALLAEFAQIRADGAAVSRGELDAEVGAVAVPVWSGTEVVAAFSAVGPLNRVLGRRTELTALLQERAGAVTARLAAGSGPVGAATGTTAEDADTRG
ncbi:IclR family transcriptional regulator [Streptomonospora sediminis]